MTEEQWHTSMDLQRMLGFLWNKGGASHRKLRLFACACCRRIRPLMSDRQSRQAIRVAEWHADGMATRGELARAHRQALSGDAFVSRRQRPPVACVTSAGPAEAAPYIAETVHYLTTGHGIEAPDVLRD